MQQLVAFAFKGTTSEKVLAQLPFQKTFLISSNKISIQQFVDDLVPAQLIVGLGDHFGKDRDRLRIETICTNKFKNIVFGSNFQTYSISPNVKPSSKSKLTKGMGNSYCNLVSYLMMTKIKQKKLDVSYVFIHIPKHFSVMEAASEIQILLA